MFYITCPPDENGRTINQSVGRYFLKKIRSIGMSRILLLEGAFQTDVAATFLGSSLGIHPSSILGCNDTIGWLSSRNFTEQSEKTKCMKEGCSKGCVKTNPGNHSRRSTPPHHSVYIRCGFQIREPMQSCDSKAGVVIVRRLNRR